MLKLFIEEIETGLRRFYTFLLLRRGFALADLFLQSDYSRIAGDEDVDDAERLAQDPTFRLIGSEKT